MPAPWPDAPGEAGATLSETLPWKDGWAAPWWPRFRRPIAALPTRSPLGRLGPAARSLPCTAGCLLHAVPALPHAAAQTAEQDTLQKERDGTAGLLHPATTNEADPRTEAAASGLRPRRNRSGSLRFAARDGRTQASSGRATRIRLLPPGLFNPGCSGWLRFAPQQYILSCWAVGESRSTQQPKRAKDDADTCKHTADDIARLLPTRLFLGWSPGLFGKRKKRQDDETKDTGCENPDEKAVAFALGKEARYYRDDDPEEYRSNGRECFHVWWLWISGC